MTSILLIAGLACSSKEKSHEEKSEVKEVTTVLENQQKIAGDDTMGVRDNKVVIQKKVLLAEELRRMENETYAMEYQVYGNREYGTKGLYGVYRDCKTDVNSPEFGGQGKVEPVEPPAPVVKEDPFFQFGKDEKGVLVGVSEEFLSERIERFKKYKTVLEKRLMEYETKVRICENDLKNAKAKAAVKQ